MNLADLAARAATLSERLAAGAPSTSDDASTLVDQRLALWCRVACNGDADAFAQRLALDGLTSELVRGALAGFRWPAGRPLPSWTATLADALRLAGELAPELGDPDAFGRQRFVWPADPVPFEEVLSPLVRLARRRLAAAIPDGVRLSEAAHGALERRLLRSLTERAGKTLLLELKAFLAQQRWDLAVQLGFDSDGGRAAYRAFVAEMLGGGLGRCFVRYPVLARLLVTAVEHWIDASSELLARLALDRPALERLFTGGRPLGDVSAIQPGMSDPHHGGRTVAIVEFTSGVKLVYKPKDLGLEEDFGRLLGWIAARDPALELATFAVLNRGAYGWAEYVAHDPCADATAVARYYHRAGALLCLLYVLDGTDASHSNLIANGEHPIFIDVETLFFPRVREGRQGAATLARDAAYEEWENSVLRTAMLPVWQIVGNGRAAVDRTGLGSDANVTVPGMTWVRINADTMGFEPGHVPVRTGTNLPTLNGSRVPAGGCIGSIVAGFRDMSLFVMKHRMELIAPAGPVSALARHRVRFVFRPTNTYYLALSTLVEPAQLRDAVDQGIQLEILWRELRRSSVGTDAHPLLSFERQALQQGDIPWFGADPTSDGLPLATGTVIASFFREPSIERTVARIRRLDAADIRRQTAYIEAAFFAHGARVDAAPPTSVRFAPAPPGIALLDRDQLVARATAIGEDLRRLAIVAGDGSAAWIAPQLDVSSGRFQVRPLNDTLYAGSLGIAVFLAALDRAAGGFRDLALGAVHALRRDLQSRPGDAVRGLGPGAGDGIGSMAYGLTLVADLLDMPAMYDDAAAATAWLAPERIPRHGNMDALNGEAGAILGLLTVYSATREPRLLERAAAFGRRVVAAQKTNGAPGSWPTLDGKPLTGMAHGAAGIALALLRLHAVTGDAAFLDSARRGIAYERSVFSATARNWPDLQTSSPGFAARWCHGAPGIGLARLGGLPVLDTPAVREDIEIAVEWSARPVAHAIDHLCCGALGLAETLVVAGERLVRPALRDAALRLASEAVTRADLAGAFALHPLLPGTVPQPMFFQGMAGIGYALLRVAAPRPAPLPSVLMWDRHSG